MKPDPSETAETFHRVRQQLILAQVRIMELEDARDTLATEVAETKQLLTSAQLLADQKIDESGHLVKVRDDLQAQFVHLRHMQHVTNEALNLTRQQLAATEQERDRLQQERTSLVSQTARLNEAIGGINRALDESKSALALRDTQVSGLQEELREIKATRSWRWTSWLRSMGRSPGDRNP